MEREMRKRLIVGCLGISEMRWTGQGQYITDEGFTVRSRISCGYFNTKIGEGAPIGKYGPGMQKNDNGYGLVQFA